MYKQNRFIEDILKSTKVENLEKFSLYNKKWNRDFIKDTIYAQLNHKAYQQTNNNQITLKVCKETCSECLHTKYKKEYKRLKELLPASKIVKDKN